MYLNHNIQLYVHVSFEVLPEQHLRLRLRKCGGSLISEQLIQPIQHAGCPAACVVASWGTQELSPSALAFCSQDTQVKLNDTVCRHPSLAVQLPNACSP